jgi:hypothetical protein
MPWRNWPDLRRDYDALFITYNRPKISEGTDLIYEGITTIIAPITGTVKHIRRNWPDLRRDYDQRLFAEYARHQNGEGTDLIYEGITTFCKYTLFCGIKHFLEGTDLIYEGITTNSSFAFTGRSWEGTDLIYEGITTSVI